jgi:hypothetical protein
MADQGDYFTINRARQFSKTTTLSRLEKTLFNQYICARISFKGIGDEPFESPQAFCNTFMQLVHEALQFSGQLGPDVRLCQAAGGNDHHSEPDL